VQQAPDSDDETLIPTNDKMLPKEPVDIESESPAQELEPPDEPEPAHSEEQGIDTPVSKQKKDWTKIVGTRDQPARKSKSRVKAMGSDLDHPTDEQARNSPQAAKGAKARERERDQLVKYGVFTKIIKSEIPEGTKIVNTKWVYTIKRNPDGSILKYKARKVGRGCLQEAGKSYNSDQTFAQMMRPETFKMLLVITVTNPYRNVGGGTGVRSESRAGYWQECQDREGLGLT